MKNFALIGAAGYIAPRHMKAIRETGNNLLCALDPYDGIGIMDSYFPRAGFFTEPERFERHLDNLRRKGISTDFVTICSPNYLHLAHIRMALRNQADVICEKPLVLDPEDLDEIRDIEKETGKRVYTVLQLRHHPAILGLKSRIENEPAGKVYDVDLTYITSRGKWYFVSWKGDPMKSGGIATNIGVHFFDMLGWIFGDFKGVEITSSKDDKARGTLHFSKANVSWFLSIDENDLPPEAVNAGKRTFRKINIEWEELEFSEGFTDLHTVTYREILEGRGYGIDDAQKSIAIVSEIRKQRTGI